MAIEKFADTPNQGISTLNETLSDSDTTITVDSAVNLKLDGMTGSDFAYCKITDPTNWRKHPINNKEIFEIVKVTAVSGNDLTVVRGQDTTSGTAFADNSPIEVVFCNIHYQQLVNALTDGTAELNIGALTITGDLLVDGGNIGLTTDPDLLAMSDDSLTVNGDVGIGGAPSVALHLQAISGLRARVDHTGAAHSAIDVAMSGVELLAGTMNTTNKYTAALKIMSTDANFTTDNPKLLGLVIGRATEGYNADTKGGVAIDFFTSPNDVGASSAPVLAMTLDQDGSASILNGNLDVNGFLILPKASTSGIKVDRTTPTFGFADILGDQFSKNTGATKPLLTTYNGAVQGWQFAASEEAFMTFHIPHDYVKGTDIFLHIHWSHIGTLVTGGTVTFKATSIYAKGHNQAAFTSTPAVGTFVGTASTTQYQQIITEVQYSDPTPTGLEVDTDLLEPDGLIEMTFEVDVNGITVSGGGVPDPFIHHVDIHYQSTGLIGTKAKAPDFYV